MMTDKEQKNIQHIINWLFICAGTVFTMVIVGAITRLTDSGLSMVEWRPLMGALPPLSDNEWDRVFNLYQNSPEYQKQNAWMEIRDFKTIFFWEWFHRLLGRCIGLLFFIPMVWFWVKNMIPTGYKWKLIGLFILGGLQGLMGWYMVKSGLVDRPDVSHYRLAMHLGLAFLIFALLIWVGLSLKPLKSYANKALHTHIWVVIGTYILTVFWGAYTAGLDAGLLYNDSFPMMGNTLIPNDMWVYEPAWINFLETHSGVQFTHRWLAMFTVVMTLGLWGHGLYKKITFPALHALALCILLQMGLGIWTLFSNVALPIATMHQAGALIILLLLVLCLHQSRPARPHQVQSQ